MSQIYLDYNATTPVAPEVFQAMLPYLTEDFGNPSSDHYWGHRARNAVDQARQQVASLVGAKPEEVIFTGCGTESDNLALIGYARANRHRGNHLITSRIEHPAVLQACRFLESDGFRISYLPVDRRGMIDPESVRKAVTPQTILISVMHANNEVGSVQPLREIAAAAPGIPLHSDVAQSIGKLPVELDNLGADMLSLAGHKLYAPKGIGALIVRRGIELSPINYGGGQEHGLRSGTENVAFIVGLGAACALVKAHLPEYMTVMEDRRDQLWERLAQAGNGLRRNGDPTHCLPNTLSVSFRGLPAGEILRALPGIAASAGSACHSNMTTISPVLEAMGIEREWAMGTLRLSVGRTTTSDDIIKAAELIRDAVERLRRS